MQEKQWYYLSGCDEVVGPLPLTDLKHFLDACIIFPETKVCKEGSETWFPIDDVLKQNVQPSILDHLSKIDTLIKDRREVEYQNALLATASGSSAFGQGFAAGNLHTDIFGNVFSGRSPFSIGHLEHPPGAAGDLHTDNGGNIYSGDSAFRIGHTNETLGKEGVLHNDVFGHVYAGNDPFPVGDLNDHEHQ